MILIMGWCKREGNQNPAGISVKKEGEKCVIITLAKFELKFSACSFPLMHLMAHQDVEVYAEEVLERGRALD